MKNVERGVQTAIVYNASKAGWHLYKIVDGAMGAKPFDIVGVSPGGIAVAIEVKMKSQLSSYLNAPDLDLHDFAAHQQIWLSRYAEAGAISIGAVCYGEDMSRAELIFYSWKEPRLHYNMSICIDANRSSNMNFSLRETWTRMDLYLRSGFLVS